MSLADFFKRSSNLALYYIALKEFTFDAFCVRLTVLAAAVRADFLKFSRIVVNQKSVTW